jgi:alkanesulfonate monooxygenase SsuD/methylene tetrahydromethanopterin reductase-like flavin-dependent oxidoreductase (luciferase family)
VDRAGLDTLWVAEPTTDAFTTVGFLAAATRSVNIGAMVTWATIRAPGRLVSMVTSLDGLTRGQVWLGVGDRYQGDETATTALLFDATVERFARLEELLRLARRACGLRLLVGGMGGSRALLLAARYADACNLFDIPDGGATLRRKLDDLARACESVGRDPAEVEVTLSRRLGEHETADQFTDRCGHVAEAGVDHVILVAPRPWPAGEALDIALAAVPAVGGPPRLQSEHR